MCAGGGEGGGREIPQSQDEVLKMSNDENLLSIAHLYSPKNYIPACNGKCPSVKFLS
jgi:hypothetical protein